MDEKYAIHTTWTRKGLKVEGGYMYDYELNIKYHYEGAWILYVLFNDKTYKEYIFKDKNYENLFEEYKKKHNLHRDPNINTLIASGYIVQRKMNEKETEEYLKKQINKIKRDFERDIRA